MDRLREQVRFERNCAHIFKHGRCGDACLTEQKFANSSNFFVELPRTKRQL
jgi:hypothetical protein